MPTTKPCRRPVHMRPVITITWLLALTLLLPQASAASGQADVQLGRWTLTTASFAGEPGDRLTGSAIQSDGTIVLVGSISGGPLVANARTLGRGTGVIVRLSEDGRRVLSATRVGDDVRDVAIDGQNNIYLAMGGQGVAKFTPRADRQLWIRPTEGLCVRVDVTDNGTVAALRYDRDESSTPGAGTIFVFDTNGRALTRFRGHRHTLDIAIDQASQTVVLVGWRQARAFEGTRVLPVQIAYMRGVDFQGQTRYTLYDWPVDRDAPDFLNRPENNMADTRGYRIAMGRDGRVYSGFEAAGGNHIFRYEPQLENGRWVHAMNKKPRGDRYFEWHNSRSEHKLFVAAYNPGTGEYLVGQQFAGRLSSGRTNAVRMVDGALAADESGRVLAGGAAASGLPITAFPPNSGEHNAGAYLLLLSPGMTSRELVTRFTPGGQTMSADIRQVNRRSRIVVTGRFGDRDDPQFGPVHAIQRQGRADAAFFAVLHESPGR